MSEIWTWSSAETARHVANGDVSAREVAETVLARISAIEPKLNALSEVTEAIALDAADAVDSARANGETLGPLAGVPITTKNNIDQAGTLNTGGIKQAKTNMCQEDSPLVANLKAAGAVVVGRSNVPAFSFRWFTDTDLHGRTFNPHDPGLSPGGSSGGAGAAVASGMCALAHGNDIGGSIRFPAHANGIAGLRPTVARVPSYNASTGGLRAVTGQLIAVDGPLARSVDDLRLGVNAMQGADARDPQHVPMPEVAMGALPKRVGLVRGSGLGQPAPEVDAALSLAAKALEAAGCAVEEITLPDFEKAYQVWANLVFAGIEHHFMNAIRASEDRALLKKIETALEIVQPLDAGQIMDLWAERVQIMRKWSLMFAQTPVVVMPISYRHGLKVDADQGDRASLERLFFDQSPMLATALLGHPGLAVPTGLAADGAPTGVQLAAKWWDEATMLSVGSAIEAACGSITPVTPH